MYVEIIYTTITAGIVNSPIGILVIAITHSNTAWANAIIPIDCNKTFTKFNLLYLIANHINIIAVDIANGIK